MYANIGMSLLRGGVPFVDMWDIKPPPIYTIYAAGIALFGATTAGIRAIDLLFVPVGMIGLYALGLTLRDKRTGLVAALLYGLFYFNDGFQNLTQSDSLATVPTIWAALSVYYASQSGRWQGSLALGLLSGLLLWFKPQQYALLVAAFLLYFVLETVATRRRWWRHGIAFACGGLLTGGSLLLYYNAIGVIDEILIVAQGTAAYNAQGYDWGAFASNMRAGFYYRWWVWHSLIGLAGLWLGTVILGRNRHRGWRLLGLWGVAGLGFAFMQAKGFDTHWFPLLPVMAMMGGVMVAQAIEQIDVSTLRRAVYAGVLILLIAIPTATTWGGAWDFLLGRVDQATYWDHFQANDLKPEQSLAMATYLRERVVTGDSLFIWGFRPEVYFMAGLRPATRYQAHFPLVAPWYPSAWRQEAVDILWAAMPPYVLVLEDDYMPWVTDDDADSHTLLQSYEALNNWLIANYKRVDQIGDFIIWQRR